MPENAGNKQSGRFKPGQSGNPAGKPRGARHKSILALEALAQGKASAILTAMIQKAEDGDVQAGRAILERLWPPRKGTPMTFDMPKVETAADLPAAISAVTMQVADGDLSPDEGALVVGLLEAQRKAIETSELAARVAALEERMPK